MRSEAARAVADGKVRPLRQLPASTRTVASGARARWLEPYGGDAEWARGYVGQIVALHERYPKALA